MQPQGSACDKSNRSKMINVLLYIIYQRKVVNNEVISFHLSFYIYKMLSFSFSLEVASKNICVAGCICQILRLPF